MRNRKTLIQSSGRHTLADLFAGASEGVHATCCSPRRQHAHAESCRGLSAGLLSLAAARSFVKIGAMVFLCHDINDIFLEAAKMARYAQQKTAANVLFVAFMLSWFTSRIFYFPVYLIRSVYYEPIEVRCMQKVQRRLTWSFHNCMHAECLLSVATCRPHTAGLRYALLRVLLSYACCASCVCVHTCMQTDMRHAWVQLVAKVYNINPHPHWEIFLALLCFLFALHLYWRASLQSLRAGASRACAIIICSPLVRGDRSYLIIKVVVKQIRNGEPDDVREDDD